MNAPSVGANAHAADKAAVPPDKMKVVSSHHAHADHRSGFDWTSLGEHRSARPSTRAKDYATKLDAVPPDKEILVSLRS